MQMSSTLTNAAGGAATGAAAGSSFGPWGAVIGGGLGLVGGLMANRANRGMSREQMAFQERMSNTAHQREVRDLRLAGLNPILSATRGQGATTPTGAQATMQNVMAPAVSSAVDALRLEKEINAVDSQIALNHSTSTAQAAAAMRDASSARQNDAQTKVIDATFGAVKAEAKSREGHAQEYLNNRNYYNLNKRIGAGLDNVSSAASAANPLLLRGLLKNRGNAPGLKKNQGVINFKTGEIIRD